MIKCFGIQKHGHSHNISEFGCLLSVPHNANININATTSLYMVTVAVAATAAAARQQQQ